MDFLDELNESQRQAVEYTDGASLVIAGAGSGKTRVLTYKIAYLLKKGMTPSSILALTFTNKAAREMKERVAKMVGEKTARYLWMGTFHSIFSRMLRSEAERIGYSKNFTIYDSADSKSLVKSILKELKLDDKVYKPGFIQSKISFAKNNLITPDSYAANTDQLKADAASRIPLMKDIYKIYCNRCKQADAMDFDDLLLQTNVLFRNHSEILQKYRHQFGYILVDEYQDTNFAQYMIVRKLSEEHERICVVGDDAQSIYSFRGANIDNILSFKNSYKSAQVFKLEQNYRSTQTIVNAANSLIDKNSKQIRKTVFSKKETGKPIKILSVFTDFEEGFIVAKHISDLRFDDFQYQDIAVLYRTNSQSRVMEEALRKHGIPYRIYGGLSFYQRKEIKDVIAYFRLVCNPNDEEALKRIINFPARGIGETTVNKLIECSQLHAVSAWEVLSDILKYNLPVNAGTANKLAQFRNMIDVFAQQVTTQNAYDLANIIVKTSGVIADTYTDHSPESISRQDNVQELLKAIHEFCETKQSNGENSSFLPDFLVEVSLLTDQDTDKETDKDKITLMTVHAAKGLEFKAVFIVGMEEELFPSPFCVDNERELEEERRLFYVAITRAEELCFISYAKSRFRNGKTNFSNPSRFIKDIDEQFLDLPTEQKIKQSRMGDWDDDFENERQHFQSSSFKEKKSYNSISELPIIPKRLVKLPSSGTEIKTPLENSTIPIGVFVKHAVFGIGKVLETSISNGNEKVDIDFGEKGVKSLLLKFAKLEILK
jgi:DNA helicase-2/ATP-dependent DNA helicase PcrA